jgi:hypothetical protein
LICQDPATGSSIDCDAETPTGTVAFYKCNSFYTSPFGDSEGGRLTCNPNGKWGRLTQYDDFVCRLGKIFSIESLILIRSVNEY